MVSGPAIHLKSSRKPSTTLGWAGLSLMMPCSSARGITVRPCAGWWEIGPPSSHSPKSGGQVSHRSISLKCRGGWPEPDRRQRQILAGNDVKPRETTRWPQIAVFFEVVANPRSAIIRLRSCRKGTRAGPSGVR